MPTRPKSFRLGPLPDPRHKEAKAFYDSSRWRRLRAVVLAEEPICRVCDREPSVIGHHIIERSVRPDLELVRSNIMGVCDECHTRLHKGSKPWTR